MGPPVWRLHMTKKIAFLYSVIIVIFVGFLFAVGEKYIYPDWAARNGILLDVILGAIAGLIGPLVWYRGQRKE